MLIALYVVALAVALLGIPGVWPRVVGRALAVRSALTPAPEVCGRCGATLPDRYTCGCVLVGPTRSAAALRHSDETRRVLELNAAARTAYEKALWKSVADARALAAEHGHRSRHETPSVFTSEERAILSAHMSRVLDIGPGGVDCDGNPWPIGLGGRSD